MDRVEDETWPVSAHSLRELWTVYYTDAVLQACRAVVLSRLLSGGIVFVDASGKVGVLGAQMRCTPHNYMRPERRGGFAPPAPPDSCGGLWNRNYVPNHTGTARCLLACYFQSAERSSRFTGTSSPTLGPLLRYAS